MAYLTRSFTVEYYYYQFLKYFKLTIELGIKRNFLVTKIYWYKKRRKKRLFYKW